MMRLRFFTAGMAGTLLLTVANPAQAEWITSWSAAPMPAMPAVGPFGPTPSFDNQTLRQTIRISAGGDAVRIRLTNAYGQGPIEIGQARIVLVDPEGREIPGTSHMLTFGGSQAGSMAKAAPLLSDPVSLKAPPLSRMAISLYLPGKTGLCSCHAAGFDDLEISEPGNFVAAPFKPATVLQQRAFLASVEVDAPKDSGTIAILGDSISDGSGSTPRANHRWPDFFAERLSARKGRLWAVANQGIGGNRVLGDGAGESALARFDRDIVALPGVKAVIIFEGINDLGLSFGKKEGPLAQMFPELGEGRVKAEQIIAGYRQLIARARSKGLKVFGATLAPYKGATYWSPAGEVERQKINDWIRGSGAFDGVLDFAKVVADPHDDQTMAEDLHAGDHLHGNDAAYRKIADSIDLNLFDK